MTPAESGQVAKRSLRKVIFLSIVSAIVLPPLALLVGHKLAPVVWWQRGSFSFELVPKNEGVDTTNERVVLTAVYEPTRPITVVTTDLIFGFWSVPNITHEYVATMFGEVFRVQSMPTALTSIAGYRLANLTASLEPGSCRSAAVSSVRVSSSRATEASTTMTRHGPGNRPRAIP